MASVDEGEGFGQLSVRMPDEGFRDLGAVFEIAVAEVIQVAKAAVFQPECVAGIGL